MLSSISPSSILARQACLHTLMSRLSRRTSQVGSSLPARPWRTLRPGPSKAPTTSLRKTEMAMPHRKTKRLVPRRPGETAAFSHGVRDTSRLVVQLQANGRLPAAARRHRWLPLRRPPCRPLSTLHCRWKTSMRIRLSPPQYSSTSDRGLRPETKTRGSLN